jgi:cyclopropane fatty-acyl-phospholipid synthase-like methyltransferase
MDYKSVWNNLSTNRRDAVIHVAGYDDEALLHEAAVGTVGCIEELVGIRPTDTILEIGCGVGRVASVLAPRVTTWIGCDVSKNMLQHARERLKLRPNTRLVEISGYDLSPVADASVDVVYCTVVFMHLEEWDRWEYVREAFRVLKPGGRLWVDNMSLCTDDGWALFLEVSKTNPPGKRPPHISRASTPQELETYFRRAGFTSIQTRNRLLWVDAWGVKPA